jgi:hypothetical protein
VAGFGGGSRRGRRPAAAADRAAIFPCPPVPVLPSHAHRNSGETNWFTPPWLLELVHQFFFPYGGIELDPASCKEANEFVQATRFFPEEADGLCLNWFAKTLFLNPPYGWRVVTEEELQQPYEILKPIGITRPGRYSNQELWAEHLVRCYKTGGVKQAILLTYAAIGDAWFMDGLKDYVQVYLDERLRFVRPGGADGPSPTKGNALTYFGPNPERFTRIFGEYGRVSLPHGYLRQTGWFA